MNTDTDFCFTKFVRPSREIPAKWIGSIGDTGSVEIRYWINDPQNGRFRSVEIIAHYCPEHCLCYLSSDYPLGCPECWLETETG